MTHNVCVKYHIETRKEYYAECICWQTIIIIVEPSCYIYVQYVKHDDNYLKTFHQNRIDKMLEWISNPYKNILIYAGTKIPKLSVCYNSW